MIKKLTTEISKEDQGSKIKKYDPEETKKILLSQLSFPGSKQNLLKEFSDVLLPACNRGSKKERISASSELCKRSIELLRLFEGESHVGLMETFEERYRMLSSEMTTAMIYEFNCANEAEKALAELIVNAYIRVIDNSRRLNNELETREITSNRNIYIANLSKQIDRANRQFISALLVLKQVKSPQIEMNIKANNAFVSSNQQFNISNDETIKPQ